MLLKKLIKCIVGRNGYGVLLNTKLGNKLHDRLHSQSSTSRDFLLQILPKFSTGAEIGVNDGDFSERILEIVMPNKLHLIDPWKFESDEFYDATPYGRENVPSQKMMDEKYENVRNRFKNEIRKDKIIINRGPSEKILSMFEDNYFDWVYIDGNHLYEFVKKDLILCIKKVKDGGIIAGDDYYDGGWCEGGVKKAVDEFVNAGLIKLIQIKNNQFILQK
ncbi:class I SAM-dependent methyltransferase [Candidatus Nitrosotenuis chungbukensis]|uniref:class I SAM-dependent methyltransferase n=1 Tax=Candidatus Nitrosotenuis chungbukensis TaxID=1353246 RepID=UPI0012FF36F9|nr:class I SAM-dependent methyltransferase [Candidatus Nitrosotenuis chungbukensis]WKT58333.1 class I SAM-dependent methyltransferase [Candidatus Nitrosotenuis chungbukensis]